MEISHDFKELECLVHPGMTNLLACRHVFSFFSPVTLTKWIIGQKMLV